jgi:hypothetical protein
MSDNDEDTVIERTWRVPASEGYGPVFMTMRIPEVTITDSAGRFIVISPSQSDVVSARLANINDWLRHGDADWLADEAVR